ncbi:single-stranded DNA-binding protein [Deinococcus planocerae]|uniref:single-stranded DNA-binding protein n=1 Tax=Deinococcus planocerae TaxID=1737569 RepID=UPI000C7EB11E|nr:single-stranded DNA-binding protein [Deinococcus planocerae]
MADPHSIREALRAALTAWAVAEVRGDQARVTLAPDPDALAPHLDPVDESWSLGWACESAEPPVVRARLTVGGATREGLSGGHTLHDAKLRALADAARFFGVPTPAEGQWVEYDPEDGPNTSDLDAEVGETPAARSTPRLPDPPRDPQMDKARRHIEELLEQLKAAGKGGEATRVLLRGYGETVQESRAIYKELQAILKG